MDDFLAAPHVALMITPATAMPASSETDRRRSREASTARWATGGLLQPRGFSAKSTTAG